MGPFRGDDHREMKLLIDGVERNGRRGAVLPARPAVPTPDMLPEIREAVR